MNNSNLERTDGQTGQVPVCGYCYELAAVEHELSRICDDVPVQLVKQQQRALSLSLCLLCVRNAYTGTHV